MNEADFKQYADQELVKCQRFKQYADQELVKCQRFKQIWKNATNPTIKSKAFFAWCIKRFQLQQIHIYSPEPITPYNQYSMSEAVGYF